MEKTKSQIHVSVNVETRNQWLAICDALNGKTQSFVFKNLIHKIHDSISEIENINSYERTD